VEDLNRVLKGLQDAARREFPNPERVGCPGADVLAALARRTLPHTHPAAEHLTHCSPCYTEFMAIRQRVRRERLLRIFAIAACLLLLVAGAAYVALQRFGGQTSSTEAMDWLTLDLRPYSENRGLNPSPATALGPLRVPRKRAHLTLQLPVGADEGQYTMQIKNDARQVVIEKRIQAALRDHIVTATCEVDLTKLTPGRYELSLRTGQDGWHTYPLSIGGV
jgi:hypothetical protein